MIAVDVFLTQAGTFVMPGMLCHIFGPQILQRFLPILARIRSNILDLGYTLTAFKHISVTRWPYIIIMSTQLCRPMQTEDIPITSFIHWTLNSTNCFTKFTLSCCTSRQWRTPVGEKVFNRKACCKSKLDVHCTFVEAGPHIRRFSTRDASRRNLASFM